MTHQRQRLFLITMAVTLFSVMTAEGQSLPRRKPQERYAVFIGADSPIVAVAAQQRKVATLLRRDYGYRAENVIELYGEETASINIQTAFVDLIDKIGPSDTLFVHLALPSVRMNDDLLAIPYGSDPSKPWTLWSSSDVASWLLDMHGRSIFAIVPACGQSGGGSQLREMLFSGKRAVAIDVAMLCDESTALAEKSAILLEQLLSTGESPVIDSRQVLMEMHQRFFTQQFQQVAASTGYSSPFSFIREIDRLRPLLDEVEHGKTSIVRIAAVQQLVKTIQEEPVDSRARLISQAVETLMRAANDEERVIRFNAYWAIGELRHPTGAGLAGRFDVGDDEEKRQVIIALAKIGGELARETVARALDDESAIVRLEAIRAAAILCGDGLTTDRALLAALLEMGRKDPSAEVRAGILQALAVTKAARSTAELLQLVQNSFKDSEPTVRYQAVLTWVELGRSAVIEPLVSMLRSTDNDRRVRQGIAYALASNNTSETLPLAIETLVAVLRSRQDPSIREAAAFSLGRLGDSSAQRALAFVAESETEDENVRVASIDALGTMKAAAINALTIAAVSPSRDVRRAAVRALGESGDPRALQVLFTALADSDSLVRDAAAAAVEKINPGRRSGSALIAKLRNQPSAVRVEAAEKLAEFPTPETAEALVAHLGDPDPEVRKAIVATLTKFKEERLAKYVIAALDRPNDLTKQGAIMIIGAQGRIDQREKITSMASNSSLPEAVRVEAVRALANLGAPDTIFVEFSSSPDAQIRKAAVDALSRFETKAAIAALARCSVDEVPSVRDAAIAALRKLSPRASVQ